MSCFLSTLSPWAYTRVGLTRPDVYVSDRGGLIRGWSYTRVGLSVAVYGIRFL